MEKLGDIGSSREVGIYSDGDGDFRPKFEFSEKFEEQKPAREKGGNRMYDAG